MDSDTSPVELDPKLVSKAVNRRFRGGKNRQRPPFIEMELNFENSADETLFRNGNVQAVYPYLKVRNTRRDGIFVAVAGAIYYLTLVNETGYAYKIATGNNAFALHAFFAQAEEWIYVQDGEHRPIFWNGVIGEASRRSVEADNEMPIGTIMAYAQARMFVTNAYNQMVASDVMFGKGFTDTRNVQKFTETTYWNEGGFFIMPSHLGRVSGAIVMPAFGANVRGQGELVIMGEDGGMSYDVSVTRPQWKDQQIARVALAGRGCLAPYSLINVNGDAWYRSADGWDSYTNDRIDLAQKVAFRKFTREVNYWLDEDSPHLIRYASHVFFDNRILGTVSPFVALPNNPAYGSHRYFRGIISLDIDHASGLAGGSLMNFDGLWTGIRPTGLVRVRDRAFAMSYDGDGINRLYEITKGIGNDNGTKKVLSHYVTKHFSFPPNSSEFHNKKLNGGEVWISEVKDRVGLQVNYRPDNSPCWHELGGEMNFGTDNPEVPGQLPFSRDRSKKFLLGSPNPDDCVEGTDRLAVNGSTIQLIVEVEGNAKIDRVRIEASSDEETNLKLQGDCPSEESTAVYGPIQCKSEEDYKYLIVDGQSTINASA
jgi:hypothetical protein